MVGVMARGSLVRLHEVCVCVGELSIRSSDIVGVVSLHCMSYLSEVFHLGIVSFLFVCVRVYVCV